MPSAGYIKLFRQILENPIMQDSRALHVFIWCLLRANYKKREVRFGGSEVTLDPGEFITGRLAGSESCGMPPSTFRNALERLRRLRIISIRSDNKKSIITIVNWARFQFEAREEDTQRTAEGQREDTDKNVTMKDQTSDFNPNTVFNQLWALYPRPTGRETALLHFKRTVKSASDFERISKALENYKAQLLQEKTPEKYVLSGGRWFSEWQEYENRFPPERVRSLSPLVISNMEHDDAAHA
jgi:hypothetical protein